MVRKYSAPPIKWKLDNIKIKNFLSLFAKFGPKIMCFFRDDFRQLCVAIKWKSLRTKHKMGFHFMGGHCTSLQLSQSRNGADYPVGTLSYGHHNPAFWHSIGRNKILTRPYIFVRFNSFFDFVIHLSIVFARFSFSARTIRAQIFLFQPMWHRVPTAVSELSPVQRTNYVLCIKVSRVFYEKLTLWSL